MRKFAANVTAAVIDYGGMACVALIFVIVIGLLAWGAKLIWSFVCA